METRDLAGQVAVVTGAAQGIGEAIARRFAAAGARVVVADRQAEKGEAVAASIRAAGGEAAAIEVDIADHASVARLRAGVRERFGKTGVLVNNAAYIPIGPFLDTPPDAWERAIATNLTGTYHCSRAFLDDMRELGTGSIVVVSSVNGIRGQVGLSPYNVTKAGLIMLAQTMALEVARYGIRVNALAPGDIATAVIDNVADQESAQANIPLARYGRAEEVAEAALFLAGARSSYTTGSVLTVDGGLTAQLYPGDILGAAT